MAVRGPPRGIVVHALVLKPLPGELLEIPQQAVEALKAGLNEAR